jgi:hypothetical protein
MYKSVLISAILFIISHVSVNAQNPLPEDFTKKIPDNYTLVNGNFLKADEIVTVDFGLTRSGKYGCGSNKENYKQTSIGVNIALYSDAYGNMMEKAIPFSTFWPNQETHKPSPTGNDFTEFSETKTFEIDGGQAAYYTWTKQCVQDANKEVKGVSLLCVCGSHSKKITLGIEGDIDSEEAIAILKEVLLIINQYNFYN